MRSKVLLAVIAIWCILVGALPAQDKVQPYLKEVAKRALEAANRKVVQLEEELKNTEAKLRTRQRGRTQKETQELKASIKNLKAEIKKLKEGDEVIIPTLPMSNLAVGQAGAVAIRCRVLQILDDKTMVVIFSIEKSRIEYTTRGTGYEVVDRVDSQPMILRGMPTAGLVDKAPVKVSAVFVVGTEKHGSSTVFVLEPIEIQMKELQQQVKAEIKQLGKAM